MTKYDHGAGDPRVGGRLGDPDEGDWLKDFRDAPQSNHRDAITRVVLFRSRARGDWNEARHQDGPPGPASGERER
jgi:hypothetical protein